MTAPLRWLQAAAESPFRVLGSLKSVLGFTEIGARLRLDSVLGFRWILQDVSVVLRWSSRRQSVDISLRGRSDELATAFSNLLDNAVRHSPSGSSVSVEVEIEDTRPGRWAIIRVRDEGPGVDLDVAPRLFERFFSTDAEHGTGLGLSIVRAVAESHGGSAELEPSAAPGACFKVRLPVLY